MVYLWDIPLLGLNTVAIPGQLKWKILSSTRHGLYYEQCSEI